jgi:hypothetical protein
VIVCGIRKFNSTQALQGTKHSSCYRLESRIVASNTALGLRDWSSLESIVIQQHSPDFGITYIIFAVASVSPGAVHGQ